MSVPDDPGTLDPRLPDLCEQLVSKQMELEEPDAWPAEQLQLLSDTGVLAWTVPEQFGGQGLVRRDLAFGYEQLGGACLTTTFVLTQRNAAVARIGLSQNDALKQQLLTQLCTNEIFATVGISHLTTSGQHLDPAVTAKETSDGFILSGKIPWVTGARFADYIVTGATLDDGRQVLLVLDKRADGIEPLPAGQLMALNASHTGAVKLSNVLVPTQNVLTGPVEGVMQQGKAIGAGSLTTSSLALGVAGAAIRNLTAEADRRPELEETTVPLADDLQSIREDMYAGIDRVRNDERVSAESVRKRANSLVLRATQAYLAASKGAGFSKGHPAERAVREAMFFLVWSCPQPVLTANLREFACASA
ncbi:MAG: acyl-CoA dehydrogenase family protein [Planctomycetaceae bacterium]